MTRKKQKGEFGYLKEKRTREILWTIISFGISLSLYIAGLVATHTNKNLLTLVAVLGCLPASRSATSMIMYIRAKGCSESAYQRMRKHSLDKDCLFDLYLTSLNANFQISVACISHKTLIALTETESIQEKELLQHLHNMFLKNGLKDITFKLYTDLDSFSSRALELQALETEEKTGYIETAKELMKDLSL